METHTEVARQVTKYRGRRNDPALWLGTNDIPADRYERLFDEFAVDARHGERPLALYAPRKVGFPPILVTDRALYGSSFGRAFGRHKTPKADRGHQRILVDEIDDVDLSWHAYDVGHLRVNDRWTFAVMEPGGYVLYSLVHDIAELNWPVDERTVEPEVWLHDQLIATSERAITTKATFPMNCTVCMAPTDLTSSLSLQSNRVTQFSVARFFLTAGWFSDKTQQAHGTLEIPYCSEHIEQEGGVVRPRWGADESDGGSHLVLAVDSEGHPRVTAIGLRFTNPEYATAFAALNDLPLG